MGGGDWLAQDAFLLAGEFHYFRVPAGQWAQRLGLMRDAGLTSVSTYVPWNWHQPRPDEMDLTGRTCPEKDLLGALEAIAAAGLTCVLRPGPYITSEWRGGGIPTWLWELHPEVLALRADGTPTAIDPYPVLTYDAPAFRKACSDWYAAVLPAVAGHLAAAGGPIVNVQLDDEPSYWQRLAGDPTLTDYNPVLVAAHDGGPSRYGRWLLDRHGDLAGVNEAHRTSAASPLEIGPPATPPQDRDALVQHLDWFEFKLSRVDRYVEFLYGVLREHDPATPVSLLHPYLLPLTAGRFRSREPGRDLSLQLTNEVYSSLFGPASSREPKVAAIVSTHEAYHAWRGPEPAVTMEIQASNATYLPSGAMELLYAVSIARGIKGLCFYMMVGGTNPPGYELGTGPGYDVSAPITRDGGTRPHYAVIRKLAHVLGAMPELLAAEPVRDVAIGWWVPYEEAALLGAKALADIGEAMATTFDGGQIGTSEALSLQSLMTDASVSYGYADLETCTEEQLHAVPQLWVPAFDRMPRAIQERLAGYVAQGGDLVLLPAVPTLDERGQRCDVLARLSFGDEPAPAYAPPEPFAERWERVLASDGQLLLAAPAVTVLPVAADAEVLAVLDTNRPDSSLPDVPGRPCAVRRRTGSGRVTALGFRLQYVPTESPEHRDFLLRLLPATPATGVEPAPLVAMQLQGVRAGALCLVNPVPVPVTGRVRYRSAGGADATLPAVLDGVSMRSQGARLLPVGLDLGAAGVLQSATWELVQRATGEDGTVHLGFDTAGDAVGEVVLSGADARPGDGTTVTARVATSLGTALLLTTTGPLARLTLVPPPS